MRQINDRTLSKDQLNNEEEVNQVVRELDKCSFFLSEVDTKPQSSSPKLLLEPLHCKWLPLVLLGLVQNTL